jgi:predicted  nucleic acid-binding Zn-ribbon protein
MSRALKSNKGTYKRNIEKLEKTIKNVEKKKERLEKNPKF